jgi:hypothetical protein
MTRTRIRNGCGCKMQFATLADASTVPNTRAYPCPVCYYWHVTRMSVEEFEAQRQVRQWRAANPEIVKVWEQR